MGNTTNVEKEATMMLIVRQRKEKINTMMLTTYLWEPHYVENSKKKKMKKIPKNG